MKNHLHHAGLLAATLLTSTLAQAQLVVPTRVVPLAPSLPIAPVITPVIAPTLPVLPRPESPVLPIPTLPGVPVYRLVAPVAVAQPVAAAEIGAAVPVAAFGKKAAVVDHEQAGAPRPSAPVRAIERARRGFGLQGKKVDAPRLQAIFDGTNYDVDEGEGVVIIEEIERPQTLPEADLLREIGVAYPGK